MIWTKYKQFGRTILITFIVIFLAIIITLKTTSNNNEIESDILKIIHNVANRSYADIVYVNWKIKISSNYEEIYSLDDSGWMGDGFRYHVFQYDSFENIQSDFDWEIGPNNDIEEKVNEIILGLNVEINYRPNYTMDYIYYHLEENDDIDNLYFLFFPIENKLYVIESFI